MKSGSAGIDTGGLTGRRCLVLGTGGFLGRSLVKALAEIEAEVTGFGRKVERPDGLAPSINWAAGPLEDVKALLASLAGQEIVFHLVGTALPSDSNRDLRGDIAANPIPTLGLLEAAGTAGVAKVVFASSGGTVYGVPHSVRIAESAATDPITAYGISKLAIEEYLALNRRLHGLDYRILRIANAYGPGQSPFRSQGVVAAILYRIHRKEPVEIWGDGSVVRDFVHVDDVAAAFLCAALHRGLQRIFNVGSGASRSLLLVVQKLIALEPAYRHLIAFRPGRATHVAVNILDSGLIAREAGWRPAIAWPDGVRATADWMASCPPRPKRALVCQQIDYDPVGGGVCRFIRAPDRQLRRFGTFIGAAYAGEIRDLAGKRLGIEPLGIARDAHLQRGVDEHLDEQALAHQLAH
jgi:UDP-glucose 4-epimerase